MGKLKVDYMKSADIYIIADGYQVAGLRLDLFAKQMVRYAVGGAPVVDMDGNPVSLGEFLLKAWDIQPKNWLDLNAVQAKMDARATAMRMRSMEFYLPLA